MRASTPNHWQEYWQDRRESIGEVYANEDRMLRQLEGLPLSGRRVLEVGAGSGRDSIELGRRGCRIYVLDYVRSSFEVIRSVAAEQGVEVVCVCADATRMPFRDRSFALVFHQGLMEHFRDPIPLLRENFRVTEEGGHCLVDVPQRYHIYTVAKHFMIALNRWFAGWETEFSPRQLERLMREAGFSIRKTDGDWFQPGFFYRGVRYVLLRLRIARLPLYPRLPRIIGAIPAYIRRNLRTKRAGLYTFAMINSLGRRDAKR